ncbi:CAMK family protein kinase [Emericellopsis atlantica]|uniref:CAMK family protein kinase n=1 Tax=Emericellopsis atlantica TaxID=2614577 RepID=A0A9P7ZIB5_9HYPO|nr:CAMK family protein kinase [Emericellopsis atlantica]KAG9252579.1 CAMK family protein kinase [Emericellopsis atlantica]
MAHEKIEAKAANRLKKRYHSQTPDARQPLQLTPLRTVKAMQTGNQVMNEVLVHDISPWSTYNRLFSFHLGDNDPVIVAEGKGISFDLFSIQHFKIIGDHQINMLKNIQHPNFVTVNEIYQTQDGCYVVCDHMARSLQEAIGNPHLDGPRLAAIIGQVVQALVYLEQKGLRLERLTCSHILLHPSGKVKLCGQEGSIVSNDQRNIRDLGYVMVELMEGYMEEGANIGLNDPDRWGADVVDFLSITTSASSADELLQVCP